MSASARTRCDGVHPLAGPRKLRFSGRVKSVVKLTRHRSMLKVISKPMCTRVTTVSTDSTCLTK